MAIRFQRKDDDTSETLTLVTLASGEEYYCDGLGRATPYLVERVTDTPSDRDEALRLLYDLDGNEARVHGVAWTPVDEAPAPHFALTAKIAARNGLTKLSMGMSADFATAIQFGATHVRVGSAIFGHR